MKRTSLLITITFLCVGFSSTADISNKTETKSKVFEEQVNLDQFSFYFVYDTDDVVTYHDCMRLCEEKNMTLVSFESEEKYLQLSQFINDNEDYDKWYWSSGYRSRKSDLWVWSASGDLEMTFFQWASGEPSRKTREESCINFMVSRGGWDDDDCEIKLSSYICDVTVPPEDDVASNILITNFGIIISLALLSLL